MSSLSNFAVTYDGTKSVQFGPSPSWHPAADEVLVANEFFALAPVDVLLQSPQRAANLPPNFGAGQDGAGRVIEVGSGVKDFSVGDRVIGQSLHLTYFDNRFAALQYYSIYKSTSIARIPDNVELEKVVGLPLAVSTAAVGLFGYNHLHLDLPQVNVQPNLAHKRKVVIVYAASGSVGGAAVQLAHQAGYAVVGTASSANLDAIRDHGVDIAIDYKASDVAEQIVGAVAQLGEPVGIFDIFSRDESYNLSARVVALLALPDLPIVITNGRTDKLPHAEPMTCHAPFFDSPEGHRGYLKEVKEGGRLGRHFYGSSGYIYQALAHGLLKPFPPVELVGKLEDAQQAIDLVKSGGGQRKIGLRL